MARERRIVPTPEPVPFATAELALRSETFPNDRAPGRLVRIGRLRVPLAGAYCPWATLYRLPDGRELWCLRLPEDGRPVRRVVSTATLVSYARRSRLRCLEAEIAALREQGP